MQVVLFCPPVTVVNGGIKHIFRVAEALQRAGVEVVVFEEQGRRPSWIETTATVVGQGVFRKDADQILILPEDQPQILKLFASWPNRKFVYAQNHFYSVLGLGGAASYADFGIEGILCSSRTIADYMRFRHTAVPSTVIPCLVDQGVFKGNSLKKNEIVCMPRKRPLEAAYLKDLFYYASSDVNNAVGGDGWGWALIEGRHEQDVARLMGEAKVFLSLSRLEGFGLTPLEAMASGCIVAGFAGIGGREYATEANGFWAAEDDFPAVIEGVRKACALALLPDDHAARVAYAAAVREALAPHTQTAFDAAVGRIAGEIFGGRK